jgi:hypothetical protein
MNAARVVGKKKRRKGGKANNTEFIQKKKSGV